MKINTVAVSEKGALKPAVRKAVLDTQTPALNEVLGDMGFVAYPEQKAYAVPIADASGNTIYLTLSVTVGLKAPNEKAERKAAAEAAAKAAAEAEANAPAEEAPAEVVAE